MKVLSTLKDTKSFLLNKARNAKYRFQKAETRFVSSGEYLLEKGEPEVHLLPDLVEQGSNVIDVGANCGAYTYVFCELVNEGGHVYCVEPLKDIARVLEKATERLNLPVTVLNCGLSSSPGQADLYVPYNRGRRIHACASLREMNGKGEKHRVELRRLDDITSTINGKISFIKIDVEGHELEVLKGGVKTLQEHRPCLLIEIEKRHTTVPVSTTFDFLKDKGYEGYFLDAEGERQHIERFDIQRDQVEQMDVFSRSYINNFIFVPTEKGIWQ